MRKAAVPTIRRATGPAAKEGRFYTVAGHCELFPSVTTILGVIDKPNLHRWTKLRILNCVRKRLDFLREESITTGRIEITEEWVEETIKEAEVQPTVEADEAAQFGTASHSIIENVIRGQEQEVDPKYAVVLENYNNWLAQSGLEIKETEKLIWSETYAYTIACAHTHTHTHALTRTRYDTAHAQCVQTRICRVVGRVGPVRGAGRPPAGGRGRLEGAHTLVMCVCVPCRVVCASTRLRVRTTRVLTDDPETGVVGLQTTNYVQPQYALQVAAYAKALGEMTGTPVEEVRGEELLCLVLAHPSGNRQSYCGGAHTGLDRAIRQDEAQVAGEEGGRPGPNVRGLPRRAAAVAQPQDRPLHQAHLFALTPSLAEHVLFQECKAAQTAISRQFRSLFNGSRRTKLKRTAAADRQPKKTTKAKKKE